MSATPSAASLRPALIFLIGPRGSGKTTIARLLAARLGWDWIDADVELERRCGVSIRSLFASEGEAVFRDRESATLADLCRLRRHVIATGGGVVLRPENRELLRATTGRIVWLTADAATLAARLQADADTSERRPSLTGVAASSLEEIERVLRQREPIYRACADHIVGTEGRTPEDVVDEVLTLMAPGSCRSAV